jgi:hypothetical protein
VRVRPLLPFELRVLFAWLRVPLALDLLALDLRPLLLFELRVLLALLLPLLPFELRVVLARVRVPLALDLLALERRLDLRALPVDAGRRVVLLGFDPPETWSRRPEAKRSTASFGTSTALAAFLGTPANRGRRRRRTSLPILFTAVVASVAAPAPAANPPSPDATTRLSGCSGC